MPTRRLPNVILGDALRRLREERGLSQEALARASGVHPNYVGLIERGERNPGWNRLVYIAEVLDITMVELAAKYEELNGTS